MGIQILKTTCIVLVGFYLIRTLIGHILTWYYFSHHDRFCPRSGYAPTVSVIKPVRGLDQLALDNFRSFCKQEYQNHYEILFCVENREDPVVPVIERLINEYPDKDIRLVFSVLKGAHSVGKMKNMITGFAESQGDVIVFSDSDVHVPPTFISNVVACTENPDIGLGFSAPAYQGSRDCASAMLSIAVNEAVLNVTPLCLLGMYNRALGMTMVVRRDVLEEIGGLEQFGHELGDDVALARAIHEKGYRIHLLKEPARIFHVRDTFAKAWCHALRWLVSIRHYSPITVYLAALADLPLVWSLLYLTISLLEDGKAKTGLLLVGTAVLARLISIAVINVKFVHDKKLWAFIWVAPILDFFKVPLLIYSFMTNEIVWRGRKVRIEPDCTAAYFRQER
jgi:ceramide glucosyltransferase